MQQYESKLLLLLTLLIQPAGYAQLQKPTALGIVAPLEQDSLTYASGFSMLGKSAGRMLSPALTEEQFLSNLKRIKAVKCKVYI